MYASLEIDIRDPSNTPGWRLGHEHEHLADATNGDAVSSDSIGFSWEAAFLLAFFKDDARPLTAHKSIDLNLSNRLRCGTTVGQP